MPKGKAFIKLFQHALTSTSADAREESVSITFVPD